MFLEEDKDDGKLYYQTGIFKPYSPRHEHRSIETSYEFKEAFKDLYTEAFRLGS